MSVQFFIKKQISSEIFLEITVSYIILLYVGWVNLGKLFSVHLFNYATITK